MTIGACRVSTDDNNPDVQRAAWQRGGCKRIGTDKVTGAMSCGQDTATTLARCARVGREGAQATGPYSRACWWLLIAADIQLAIRPKHQPKGRRH